MRVSAECKVKPPLMGRVQGQTRRGTPAEGAMPRQAEAALALKRSSAANQINDQHDDCDHKQQMDQRTADMPDEAKQPKYE